MNDKKQSSTIAWKDRREGWDRESEGENIGAGTGSGDDEMVFSKKAWRCYVYAHHKEDTGEIFYIGKGVNPIGAPYFHRSKTKHYRNRWWHSIVAKHGFTPPVMQWCARPVAGELPAGHYQCPRCQRAFRRATNPVHAVKPWERPIILETVPSYL